MNTNTDMSRILIGSDELQVLTDDMARRISVDYKDKNPILVCILKGGFMLFSDLVRKLTIPCEVDFMQVSSYGASTSSSGKAEIIKKPSINLCGRNIILVDDILDTGLTMYRLREYFINEGAASVAVCTMLDKSARRCCPISPDYYGAQVPDEFVVGYGLDYDEKYRNLPYIAVLNRKGE